MPSWLSFLTDPLFWEWVVCLAVIAALVVALIRKILRGKPRVNYGRSDPVGAEPAADEEKPPRVAPRPAPQQVAVTPRKRIPLWKIIEYGIIGFLVVWAAAEGFAFFSAFKPPDLIAMVMGSHDDAPHAHTPSGASQAAGVCTQASVPVRANAQDYTWVTVNDFCTPATVPQVKTGLYELKCKDLDGDEHDWSDEECHHYQAVGFRKNADASDTTPLDITVSFTTFHE